MRVTVAGALLGLLSGSPARADHRLDTPEYTLTLPDGWIEAKEVADKARAGMSSAGPGVEAATIAWSAPEKTPLAVGMFARGAPTTGGDVRRELTAAQEAVKAGLAKRMQVARWRVVEGATRMTAAFEATQGSTRLRGTSVVAMSSGGRVLGWQVVCLWNDGEQAGAETCDQVLASFSVVHADKDLRPLKGK